MDSYRSPKFLRPSLLDRLLLADAEPVAPWRGPGGDDPFALQDISDFTASVCRDLEDLLNARSSAGDVPRGAKLCSTSILNYGLPDRAYDSDAASAARMVRETIATFEPRLCDVGVEPVGTDPERFDRAHLEIRARLVAQRSTSIQLWVRFRSIGVGRITVSRLD